MKKLILLLFIIMIFSCTMDNYTGETPYSYDVKLVNNITDVNVEYRESYGLITIDLENDSDIIIIELLFEINGIEHHIYDYIAPHEVYNIYSKKISNDTFIECEILSVTYYKEE